MKVYMDVCCLNRLFDDQTQDKVRLETEAIISILKRCANSQDWRLVGSDIILFEISKNPDAAKRQKVLRLHDGAHMKTKYNAEIKSRAERFRKCGAKLLDSMHLASAEYAKVDVFLTADKQLLSTASRSDI